MGMNILFQLLKAEISNKIPFVLPSYEQRSSIDEIVLQIITSIKKDGGYEQNLEEELNEVIKTIFGF